MVLLVTETCPNPDLMHYPLAPKPYAELDEGILLQASKSGAGEAVKKDEACTV